MIHPVTLLMVSNEVTGKLVPENRYPKDIRVLKINLFLKK